ncbi:MAG TPA: AAA family ATPase [Candidatus Binatia bacterium]|jgi:DNA-binding winged helix-turn-helix (wHTH) protein/tetratricopeptide (TPR) repeat protein|nr:AAA family ATPase [Candidatus Binatia bacterium]
MADAQRSVPPAVLALGPFEVDAVAGCLRRDGTVIALRPKAWRMLLYLVERPGVLIPTEQLYTAVWGDTAVTPNTMTNVVGELRRALEDTGARPRFIETVHRRGYRFIAEPAASTRPRDGFVGRAAELTDLQSALRQAELGERKAVFISGEPGLGKTTLVEQFAAGLTGGSFARVQCIEAHGASEAYMPILHLLEQLLRGPRQDEVSALLRRFAPTWLNQLPWLLDEDESQALSRSLAGIGAARMVREGAVLLEEIARSTPLTIVVEDMHWSDGPTVDLIATLLQRTGPARLLLVATYRPIDAVVHAHPIAAMVATLRRRRGVRLIPLSAFSIAEVRRCLAHDLADDALADKLAVPVGRHTGGNPLFIKAVSAQLRHEGWLRPVAGGWELTIDLDRFAPPLPDDLRELIEVQVAALPPETLRVLEAASVAGSDITVEAVAAGLEWAPERVEDLCFALAKGSLYLRAAVSGDTYDFTHALYQRAFHDRLAPSDRRRMHGRIGECIERTHASRLSEVAARQAGHFEAAGDLDRAARYREMAGGVALRRLAYDEGVRELQTALAHLEQTPDAADATGRRARIHLSLANALMSIRGYAHPDVADAFDRAERVAHASGHRREEARALIGLGALALGRGNPRAALPLVDRLLGSATDGPSDLPQYSYVRAGHVQVVLGQPRRAMEFLALSARETPEPGIPVLVDGVAEAEWLRAIALTQLGFLDQGRAAVERALQRIDETGLAWARGVALYYALEVHLLRRDMHGAERMAGEMIEHLRIYDFPMQTHIVSFHQDYLRGIAGPSAAPLDDMRRHLAAHHASGDRWHHTVHLAEMAEIEIASGDLDAASASLDAAFAHGEWGGEERHLPELWRLRGGVRRLRADVDGAEECFRRAIDTARERDCRLFELRATVSLADLLRDGGRAAEAVPLLSDIHDWFEEGHDGADLRDAAALLRQLRS